MGEKKHDIRGQALLPLESDGKETVKKKNCKETNSV